MPTDDEPTLPGPDGLPTRDSAPSGDADGDRPTIDTPATTPGTTPARGGGGLARAPLPALPGYTVTQLIGEGGMGAVYEAQQHKPARRVALKLIRPGAVTPRSIRRFEHEQEVLARLQHPGIAAIHEAGLHDGTPFFAMEFIDGPTLTEYADMHKLGTRDRLALFAQVCDAVHHAHAKGVIHRDLKPGNILVAQLGDPPAPQAKVLDFGIARVTESDVQATTMHTDVGQVVGTLPYMSPEQVAGENDDIDTRSDVYALGVVLYQLLAGQLPYDLKQRLIHEAARVIREEEPTRLSGIDTRLRGDIETIVGKAMEKQRDRRYQSASDLGADIRRYLGDEPIQARPPSRAYQLRKFVKRHRALVVGVAATFVVLVAGVVASSVLAVRAESARQDAVAAQHDAEQAREAEQDQREIAVANAEAEREQRELAQHNADAERERAEELTLVLEFQQDQLGTIDTPQMGARLRSAIIGEARRQAELDRGAFGGDEADLAAFESTLGRLDFTGLALESLETHIFRKALATIEQNFGDRPLIKARLLETVAFTCMELGLLGVAGPPQDEALALHETHLGPEHPITLRSRMHKCGMLAELGEDQAALDFALATLEVQRRVLVDEPERIASTENMAGVLLTALGRYEEAEAYLRQAFERSSEALGPDDVGTTIMQVNLGTLYYQRRDYQDAERVFLEALATQKRVLGDGDPQVITTQSLLGVLYEAIGRYEEAEPYFVTVFEFHRRELGDEHPDTLIALSNLGVIYEKLYRLEDAWRCFYQSLETSRAVFGDDHPQVLADALNLGSLLGSFGQYEDAERLIRESLEGSRRLRGPDHQETIAALAALASLHADVGRFDEAEAAQREVIAYFVVRDGRDGPKVLVEEHNLAVFFQAAGRYTEALALIQDVLSRSEEVHGPDARRTRETRSIVAQLLSQVGELSAAEDAYRAALASAERSLPEDHPERFMRMHQLGYALTGTDKLEEAEQLHRDALAGRQRVFGEDATEVLNSRNYLGTLLASQERYDEAREQFLVVLAQYRELYGPQNTQTLTLTENVGFTFEHAGRLEEAEPYYALAYEGFSAVYGADHPRTLRLQYDLAVTWLQLGRLAQARDLAEAHYVQSRQRFGEQHETPRETARVLSMLYRAWHESEPEMGYDNSAAYWRRVWHGQEPADP